MLVFDTQSRAFGGLFPENNTRVHGRRLVILRFLRSSYRQCDESPESSDRCCKQAWVLKKSMRLADEWRQKRGNKEEKVPCHAFLNRHSGRPADHDGTTHPFRRIVLLLPPGRSSS